MIVVTGETPLRLPYPEIEQEPGYNQTLAEPGAPAIDPQRVHKIHANHAARVSHQHDMDFAGGSGIVTVNPPLSGTGQQVVTFFGWTADGRYIPVTSVVSDDLFETIAQQLHGFALVHRMDKNALANDDPEAVGGE